ncbi:MAG: Gfo/Idh/MocA family oxidoreductase [Lachnospiraceae bacterium]
MQYKVAIIGFGGMGGWHYGNITERLEAVSVKGIFDVREEAREKAADKGLYVYTSVEEILADEEIDIVTIATPNNFHKDLAITCLRGGKNVICEKPVTLNAAELLEIIAVQKETGKVFSVHQNRRWDKDYCTIKKVLSDNIIGAPYFIESRVQGSRGAMHGWRGYKENGGGMVLDWGVHIVDQMMTMIDSPVVEVGASLFSVFTPEVDDNIKINIRFENGVAAMLEMSTNCFVNHPRWHVSCVDGTAVINSFRTEGALFKKKVDAEMVWADDIVYTEAGPTRTMAPRPKETIEEIPLPEVESSWTDYYENIVAVIEGKAELIVKPEQALRVMNVIDLIFVADQQKCAISCNI